MKKLFYRIFKTRAWVSMLFFLVFLVLSFIILDYYKLLIPIRDFLDSDLMSLKLGDTRISGYLILKSIVILIILVWMTEVLGQFVEGRIKKSKWIDEVNKPLFNKGFNIVLYIVSALVGLNILGIDLTALAVLGGAVGIGIGFGLQKITSNFISGLILLWERSLKEGDIVEMSDGSNGYIRQIRGRYTLIELFDGREVMIPNEEFIVNRVINLTLSNVKGRIHIPFGVAYDSDLKKVKELVLEAVRENKQILKNPKPACLLWEFGDSSVNFYLYFWVENLYTYRYEAKNDILFAIWDKFKKNDITIPFPQMDVHLNQMV